MERRCYPFGCDRSTVILYAVKHAHRKHTLHLHRNEMAQFFTKGMQVTCRSTPEKGENCTVFYSKLRENEGVRIFTWLCARSGHLLRLVEGQAPETSILRKPLSL